MSKKDKKSKKEKEKKSHISKETVREYITAITPDLSEKSPEYDAEEQSTSDCLKLENQLCFPLYACAKEVVRRYRPPAGSF